MVINDLDIDGGLKTSQQIIFSRVQIWLGEGSRWITESADGHYIDISICNLIVGNSYMQLREELRKARKSLINLKNETNECFRFSNIRHFKSNENIS